MVFIFKDGTKKTYAIGERVHGIRHCKQRPIGLNLAIGELLEQVRLQGPERVEKYFYSVLKPTLTVGGRIYLK